MKSKQELIDELKRGKVSSEIPTDALSVEIKEQENKFNKKVDVAHKLRQLGAVVAMTASTIGASAQEKVVDTLPNEPTQNTFVLDNNDKMKSFNFYQSLKKGEYSYEDAKEAAEFVRNHIEGVYAVDMLRKNARRDYAIITAATKSEEYFNQHFGVGPISTNRHIYPKTKEASKEMLDAENNSVINHKASLDVEVTFYTIEAILKDENISNEQKEDLILKESNLLFKRVDEGLYDTDNKNGRYNTKRNYLRNLERVNPKIATTLAKEQQVDMRKLRPQKLER